MGEGGEFAGYSLLDILMVKFRIEQSMGGLGLPIQSIFQQLSVWIIWNTVKIM